MNEDKPEEQEAKQPKIVHPATALVWRCPWEECNADSAMPGQRGVATLAMGNAVQLNCRRCGNPVILARPEQPRIIPANGPSIAQPNREQRRAAKRVDRKR